MHTHVLDLTVILLPSRLQRRPDSHFDALVTSPTPPLNRYANKLQMELETACFQAFPELSDQDRVRSVLVDISKTSADFRRINKRALEQLSNGLMPKLR